MKAVLSALVLLSFFCTVSIVGCVPWLRSSKTSSPTEPAANAKVAPDRAGSTKSSEPSKSELDRLLAPPPPPDKLAAGQGERRTLIKPSDFAGRDEVSQAALMLAQGLKDVKHVKTCYSKSSGGWFLLLYVPKGNKIVEQEYFWNKDTKEWELYGHRKDLPAKEMNSYLKAELPDEKCFVLK